MAGEQIFNAGLRGLPDTRSSLQSGDRDYRSWDVSRQRTFQPAADGCSSVGQTTQSLAMSDSIELRDFSRQEVKRRFFRDLVLTVALSNVSTKPISPITFALLS